MSGTGRLTPQDVADISSPGIYRDGNGLYLNVSKKDNTKKWVFHYVVKGIGHTLDLGPTHTTELSTARIRAREMSDLLARGQDPRYVFRAGTASPLLPNNGGGKTFDECLTEYVASHRRFWRSAKHAQQWERSVRYYICPHMNGMLVSDITVRHVVEALECIWLIRTDTASRLRGRIERVLAWATAHGYREGSNPAYWRGNLEELLPRPNHVKKVRHFPSMPYQDICAFFTRLMSTRGGNSVMALAFTILTACRSSEARLSRWAEIDLINAVWTIPAERTKSGHEQRVPLSKPALDVLHYQRMAGYDPVWVFPCRQSGEPFSPHVMLNVLRSMGETVTVHGFRSSFRIWAAEKTTHPREVAEMALSHTLGSGVEMAYMRSDLLDRRRTLMREWADWCLPSGSLQFNFSAKRNNNYRKGLKRFPFAMGGSIQDWWARRAIQRKTEEAKQEAIVQRRAGIAALDDGLD